jgi:hypothetical protein
MACFAFATRRVLVPQYVRPEPPLYGLLIGLQDVLPETEAGVKKRLIFFTRGIEILKQTQQPRLVKGREPRLDV